MSSTTIQNCFAHCGFKDSGLEVSEAAGSENKTISLLRIMKNLKVHWDSRLIGSKYTVPEVSKLTVFQMATVVSVFQEFPFCSRLNKVKGFLLRTNVSKEEVINELGNGIAAFESVPTAIYSFLRCINPDPEIPEKYNGLERTIIYSISLGGDTDTIATMAGAIAGAYYGKDHIRQSWQRSCEAYKDAEYFGEKLCEIYCSRLASSLKTNG